MTLSHSTKKRFVKDFNLPIQVVQEPYFSYYMEELDEHFNTHEKLKYLTDIIEKLGSEDAFFIEANRIKDFLIEEISSYDVYTDLSKNLLEDYKVKNQILQKNVYNQGNHDKAFISIDLKHANFNVMKMYSPTLTMGFETYEDLIGSVSEFDYFKKSKYMRQVIFGNLLPKKQQRMQSWVMDQVVSVLNKNVGIGLDNFISVSADEVVFEMNEFINPTIKAIEDKLKTENRHTADMFDNFKINAFTLKSIGGENFFVKESLLTDKVEFKGIPSFLFMQTYKKYVGRPLEDKDLIFYHEGYLATFKQMVFGE